MYKYIVISRAIVHVHNVCANEVLFSIIQVISQGSVQHHAYDFERNGTTSTVVSFHATHEMIPRVKVLGVFAREDGELVADLIELDVKCSFRHRVGLMSFDCGNVKYKSLASRELQVSITIASWHGDGEPRQGVRWGIEE